jgi:hypothetical protein
LKKAPASKRNLTHQFYNTTCTSTSREWLKATPFNDLTDLTDLTREKPLILTGKKAF